MVKGESMKTLQLFGIQSCQIINWLKRCASKKAVFRCNKKSGKFKSVAPKRKKAETLHWIDSHRTKIGLNPNFHGYSKSPWTGANMHTWFYGSICLWIFFCVSKIPRVMRKTTETPGNNRFRFPIHFGTNRLTFEKFPPLPPLLHPSRFLVIATSPRTKKGVDVYMYCDIHPHTCTHTTHTHTHTHSVNVRVRLFPRVYA